LPAQHTEERGQISRDLIDEPGRDRGIEGTVREGRREPIGEEEVEAARVERARWRAELPLLGDL
jgi:hypothetical protein